MSCSVLSGSLRIVLASGTLFVLSSKACLATEPGSDGWKEAFPLTRTQDPASNAPARFTERRAPNLSLQSTEAAEPQVNPLSATVSISFDSNVRTVRDAARLVLEPIGYTLIEKGPTVSPLVQELLDSPLPRMQRELQHLRVREMLRALAGVGHVAVLDHVHRRATFDPRPRYASIGQSSVPDAIALSQSGPSVLVPTPARDLVGTLPSGSDGIEIVPESAPGDEPAPGGEQSLAESGWEAVQPRGAVNRLAPGDAVASDDDFINDIDALLNRQSPEGRARVVITSRKDTGRLSMDSEKALSKLSADFDPGSDHVLIRSCTVPEMSQEHDRQARLIGSALTRLGIPSSSQALVDCDQSVALQTELLTHVVEIAAGDVNAGAKP